MSNSLVLFNLLVCLVGCGVNPNNSADPKPGAKLKFHCANDLRHAGMTMRSDIRAAHHMTGTANSLFSSVTPDRFYWTKTGSGYPWHIQLYDISYVYLWVTEFDWQNPRAYKAFSPKLGKFNLPFAPRFAKGDTQVRASR